MALRGTLLNNEKEIVVCGKKKMKWIKPVEFENLLSVVANMREARICSHLQGN